MQQGTVLADRLVEHANRPGLLLAASQRSLAAGPSYVTKISHGNSISLCGHI